MEELFHLISAGGLLEGSGLVIYRHSPRGGYDPPEGEWSLVDSRDYGDSLIFLYRRKDRDRAGPERSII